MIRYAMYLSVFLFASTFAISMEPVSANTLSASNQVKVSATILPAIHVIVSSDNQVQQIISNTSDIDVVPTVYLGAIKSENIIQPPAELSFIIAKHLAGRSLKPGVVFDYQAERTKFRNSSSIEEKDSTWLSGIFNLKNVKPSVNLTRL